MGKLPKVLIVSTGFTQSNCESDSLIDNLDYHVYSTVPCWYRKIEKLLRLDVYLALQVKKIENQYDLIYAESEKVGIPLSFMRLKKPLVVVSHYLESPVRAQLCRVTAIAKRWAGTGYISNESKDFLLNYLHVPNDRLFQAESAKYLRKANLDEATTDGPIMSVGVAKRDYYTLISALIELEGYETELFVSSKFGDKLASNLNRSIPTWVRFPGFVSENELVKKYQSTRFVVVPLHKTTHTGAGINAVLEAGAFGKAVIATKTGGMTTFVKDGETGILVPPYNIKAMQDAINKLFSEPDVAHQMGLAGRRYMEANYDPAIIGKNISAFLEKTYTNSIKK